MTARYGLTGPYKTRSRHLSACPKCESAKLRNRVGSAAYDNADVADDVKR